MDLTTRPSLPITLPRSEEARLSLKRTTSPSSATPTLTACGFSTSEPMMYIKTSFIAWPPELLRHNGRGGLSGLRRLGDERADGIGGLRAVLYPAGKLIRVDGDLFLI